jgi:uncharacterized membrane protein YdcZ (DUF606 family)
MGWRFIVTSILIVSLLGLIYGFLWLMQTASLSGAPNYPIERAQYNANAAYVLMAGSLAVAVVTATVLLLRRKKRGR